MAVRVKTVLLSIGVAFLAGCGGGGSNAVVPSSGSGPTTVSSGSTPANVTIHEYAIPTSQFGAAGGVVMHSDGTVALSGNGPGSSLVFAARFNGSTFSFESASSTIAGLFGPALTPIVAGADNRDYVAGFGYLTPRSASANNSVLQLPGSAIGMPSNTFDTIVDMGRDNSGELWALYNGVGLGSPSGYMEKSPSATFPSGVVGFALPHATITESDTPEALAVNDTSEWVARANVDATEHIYRFDTNGTLQADVTVSPHSAIAGMAVATDGSVWFTDPGHNKIGHLTGSTVHEYSIPSLQSGAGRITQGGDGAFWFTEVTANKIGRIASDGTITEYAVPTSNAGLAWIAGPAGGLCDPHALYFVETKSQKLGKISFN